MSQQQQQPVSSYDPAELLQTLTVQPKKSAPSDGRDLAAHFAKANGGCGAGAGAGAAGVVVPPVISSPPPKKPYLCSVVTIARGENPYIREFVHYYKMIGMDHIYIYDNSGTTHPPITEALTDKEMAFCTVIPFPGKAQQRKSYVHFLDHYSMETEWVLIVDADEFLVLYKHDSIRAFIRDKCKKLFGVGINWYMFGYGQHVSWPKGKLVMESYTQGSRNQHIKTLARTEILRKLKPQCHPFFSLHNVYNICQRLNGSRIDGHFNPSMDDMDCIALYHYWSKSQEELDTKVMRGRAPSGRKRDRGEAFEHALEIQRETNIYAVEVIVPRFLDYLARKGLTKEHIVELHHA